MSSARTLPCSATFGASFSEPLGGSYHQPTGSNIKWRRPKEVRLPIPHSLPSPTLLVAAPYTPRRPRERGKILSTPQFPTKPLPRRSLLCASLPLSSFEALLSRLRPHASEQIELSADPEKDKERSRPKGAVSQAAKKIGIDERRVFEVRQIRDAKPTLYPVCAVCDRPRMKCSDLIVRGQPLNDLGERRAKAHPLFNSDPISHICASLNFANCTISSAFWINFRAT